MKRIEAYVSGRVQGVFFRSATRKKALQLNLVGYAKNLDDGRVEVVAEGPKEKLEELITFLHEGSSYSLVKNVDVDWMDPKKEFRDFSIRW